jgi:hypothetical protein
VAETKKFVTAKRWPHGAGAQALTSNHLADSHRVNLSDSPFAEKGIDLSEFPFSVAFEYRTSIRPYR